MSIIDEASDVDWGKMVALDQANRLKEFIAEAAARNAAYSDKRRRFREVNDHPGALPGYGGRGTSVVSQHKLAVSNPKHNHERSLAVTQDFPIRPHYHLPAGFWDDTGVMRPIETTGFIQEF